MKFQEINNIVGGIPFISKDNAKFIYDFIIEKKLSNILELGIAHGTATCYISAALDEIAQGKVTAVDLMDTSFTPSCEEQLKKSDLESYSNIYRMKTGYNWFLHDEIKRNTENGICTPKYDMCIIDGPKNWTIDSSAFFLVDKLLKPGGYLIFDDYNWSYAEADERRTKTDGITHRLLSEEERNTPHIKEIFELLVMQNPRYHKFRIFSDSQWVMAQKTEELEIPIRELVHYDSLYFINKELFFSKNFSTVLMQIEKLKIKNSRYLIYGYGLLGKMIENILSPNIVGFVDYNFKKLNKSNIHSPEKLKDINFDYIIISLIGREEEVLSYLQSKNTIELNKIITFNLKY